MAQPAAADFPRAGAGVAPLARAASHGEGNSQRNRITHRDGPAAPGIQSDKTDRTPTDFEKTLRACLKIEKGPDFAQRAGWRGGTRRFRTGTSIPAGSVRSEQRRLERKSLAAGHFSIFGHALIHSSGLRGSFSFSIAVS